MIWIVVVVLWLIIGFMVWQILAPPDTPSSHRRREVDRLLRRYRRKGGP